MSDTHIRYHGRRYQGPLETRLLVRAGRGDLRAEVRDARGRIVRTFPEQPTDGQGAGSALGDVSRRAEAFVEQLGRPRRHSVSTILIVATLVAIVTAALVPVLLAR